MLAQGQDDRQDERPLSDLIDWAREEGRRFDDFLQWAGQGDLMLGGNFELCAADDGGEIVETIAEDGAVAR